MGWIGIIIMQLLGGIGFSELLLVFSATFYQLIYRTQVSYKHERLFLFIN